MKKLIIILIVLTSFSVAGIAAFHQIVVAKRLANQDPHNVNIQEYLPAGIELQQVDYAKIMNKDYTDIIIQSKPKESKPFSKEYYICVLSYSNETNKFEKVFETTAEQPVLQMLTGKIFDDGRDVFITYFSAGSGGYLDYKVYGAVSNNIEILLQRSGIFQGDVWINPGKIVESSSDQAKYFTWNGSSFQETPVLLGLERNSYEQGDKKIEYWIDADQNVILTNNTIYLKKGQRLFLVRTKFGISTRIMYSANKQLKMAKDDFGHFLIADEPGNITVTIIPGGYNWNKSQKINIVVTE